MSRVNDAESKILWYRSYSRAQHCITQKDTQPSQACSGGFITAPLFCYSLMFLCELELELIQTQMTQKPMLRAEVYARALRASQNRKEDSV
jgi:hypothetical protein